MQIDCITENFDRSLERRRMKNLTFVILLHLMMLQLLTAAGIFAQCLETDRGELSARKMQINKTETLRQHYRYSNSLSFFLQTNDKPVTQQVHRK